MFVSFHGSQSSENLPEKVLLGAMYVEAGQLRSSSNQTVLVFCHLSDLKFVLALSSLDFMVESAGDVAIVPQLYVR